MPLNSDVDGCVTRALIAASADEARNYFLKGSSYFNKDLPSYISFEHLLEGVSDILGERNYREFQNGRPNYCSGVNYILIANKDGRFAWRPFELLHPVIYASLVNTICEPSEWNLITNRLESFRGGPVDCCSSLAMPPDDQSDQAAQVRSWWHSVEQKSIAYSLEFSHILHTDVTDCYGSLYTHSIAWALHTKRKAKERVGDDSLVGNRIDRHIQASRYGQTNGISQGSALMDFIAEIVLGYVDDNIAAELGDPTDYRILRYRDDYRIFANSDERAEAILQVISNCLRDVGMRLGVAKTTESRNIVEGAIKQDKLAGLELQALGDGNAGTIQKQLLRMHSFGRRFPNSGALRRLLSEMHESIFEQKECPSDLEVQVAIAADLGFVSPQAFPAIAGILSHLISLASKDDKAALWSRVVKKMKRVPYSGYLEVWLQRVTKPFAVGMTFESDEPICQIVNGETAKLWENSWIASKDLLNVLDVSRIVVSAADEMAEVIEPEEIALFRNSAWAY